MSGYRVTTERYGTKRSGQMVLVFVTETMDSRVWIKEDRQEAPESARVPVIKLNHMLYFRTGIYPYSVMTSIFSPVHGIVDRERFAPVKIAFSAQEWCGHVYHQLRPTAQGFKSEIRSYFYSEGDREASVETAAGTLYEDALLIQLRELDGPFADGAESWSGQLVPTVWGARKVHKPLAPVAATIRRSEAEVDGQAVRRFVLEHSGATRTFDIEKAAPHRVLRWTDSRGEEAVLLKTARLAYWKLNHAGEESYLEQIGLAPTGGAGFEPVKPASTP